MQGRKFKRLTCGVIIAQLSLAAGLFIGDAPISQAASISVDRYIELNHKMTQDMVTFPGLSVAKFTEHMPRFANHALIDQVNMLGISGTYIDAPYHENPQGGKIADYPLEKLVNLPIVVVTKPDDRLAFEVSDLQGAEVAGKAVMFVTGHDRYFGTDQYGKNVPYLSVELANWLADHQAALVGIDTPLVDDMRTQAQGVPVHHALLSAGVVICEDMAHLTRLPAEGAYFTAVPPRVPMASFPVRAFATVYK